MIQTCPYARGFSPSRRLFEIEGLAFRPRVAMLLFIGFDWRVMRYLVLLLGVAGWQRNLFLMFLRFLNRVAGGWGRRTMMRAIIR